MINDDEFNGFNPFEEKDFFECKYCKRNDLYEHEFPRRNGNYVTSKCLSCISKDRRKKRRSFKIQCVEYKGGCCISCGYSKCLDALEFHHLNPFQKDFMVSEVTHTSIDKVKDELDKCVLLCSNCHREIHAGINISGI